mgnify:CR=1 FL=1
MRLGKRERLALRQKEAALKVASSRETAPVKMRSSWDNINNGAVPVGSAYHVAKSRVYRDWAHKPRNYKS